MALVGLGVGGGIGAYKAVEVARGLQKNGHDVVAILTRNARRFTVIDMQTTITSLIFLWLSIIGDA